MTQLDLGVDRKEQGMSLAAASHADVLALARNVAVDVALHRYSRTVTIDDIQGHLLLAGKDLGNAAGSVFRGKDFEHAGYQKSRRASSHARVVSVWRLRI